MACWGDMKEKGSATDGFVVIVATAGTNLERVIFNTGVI